MFHERISESSAIRDEVMANPKGYVAVPKAHYDAALGMMRDPRTTVGKKFDNMMNTWKSGMLVYAPRWWVNNAIGNSLMYGMLAGADLRSVRQAWRSLRRDDLADILPPDVKEHGFVNEVLEGRRAFDNPGDNRVLTRVGRFTESMFHLQNSFEQVWRRAAYINQLKKQARDAGVLDRKLRIADADEALIAAADELPGYVKADALDKALRFLGDYQNMTQFERQYMRRVFPFYCVDEETEALTQRGWVKGEDLLMTDLVVSRRDDGSMTWAPIEAIYIDDYQGPMYRLKSRSIDALVTPGHKFVLCDGTLKDVDDLRNKHHILVMPDEMKDYAEPVVSDALVQVVGWAVTEGHYKRNRSGNITTIEIAQKDGRPECDMIREALEGAGAQWHEYLAGVDNKIRYFGVTGEVAQRIQQIAPRRIMSADFIMSLTQKQRHLLIEAMILADGSVAARGKHDRPVFAQKCEKATDAFVMLATLSGYQTYKRQTTSGSGAKCWAVTLRTQKHVVKEHLVHDAPGKAPHPKQLPLESYDGYVWCPKTPFGNFMVRRNGVVHLTGNSWLRVISRLTLTMPFKDPGRLLAMAYLGQIATQNEQPLDDLRAYYEQGALNLPGDLIMRTSGSNPLQTLVEPISKLATGDVTGASREFLGQTNPLIQLLVGKTTGVDSFTGREYTAPPIWNGSYDQFGMGRRTMDETGRVVEERPTPSFFDMFVRATPVLNQIRPALSDRYGYSPYGTTSTLDLIRFALGNKTPEDKARLFLPPSESARPITRSPWSVPLGYAGFPVLYRNEEAEVDRELKNLEERLPDAQEAARKRMEGNIRKFLESR